MLTICNTIFHVLFALGLEHFAKIVIKGILEEWDSDVKVKGWKMKESIQTEILINVT
jgi:hypothetical protein